MRSKLRTILLSCGGLCILAALAVALSVGREEITAQQNSQTALRVLSEHLEASPEAEESAAAETGEPATQEIADYLLFPEKEMPSCQIDGYDYIGILEIPSLSLSLPVMAQIDAERLTLAPCRYVGSAYLDGFVIGAHDYTVHFGRLSTLCADDLVRFTDCDGNVFSYAVERIETLAPDAIEEMTQSGCALTLFTCTYGGAERIAVRCKRIENA